MTQISLRDYLHGLEEMIDGGRAEEALTHCRHILKTFPKHVDTYRLMGKAYLELKRHSEAGDIFQRVLSSVPDDFVSHIGMSIIREDEGNGDAAIWHMERAFESQPSNRAVQDELRRLYGKREGYEPPKVRLTRGALARMYAHGDLYNQAIGELRSALSEDAQRPDLQVALAEMYFKTNRQTETIDVCSKLIEKLPYCLYANRVMMDILRNSQRDVEARPYWERVEELDPYAAQVSLNTPLEEVPADSVMLEQLEPEGQQAPPPKAWTASLQMPEESQFEKEELPDWLSLENLEEKLPSEEKVVEQPQRDSSLLKSLYSLDPSPAADGEAAEPAGDSTHGPESEEPAMPPPFTSVSPSTALQAENIPDWLRELRPTAESVPPESKPTEPSAKSEPPAAEPGAMESEDSEEPEAVAPITIPEETPAAADHIENAPVSEEDEENLSWLEGLAAKQGAADEELLTSPGQREEAAPDWLEKELPPKPKSDTLSWLDELNKEDGTAAAPAPEEAAQQAIAEERDLTEQRMPEVKPEGMPAKADTTPAWLKDLSAAADQNAQAGEPIPPRPLEEAPDWLNELRPEAAPTEKSGEAEDEQWHGEGDLSKLDWLEELGPAQEQPAPPENAQESAWVPEAEMASTPTKESAPTIPQAPRPMSPRKTAQLAAAEMAPAKLEQARQALNYGKLMDAADHYSYLLRRRVMLEEIIADLTAAVRRHPQDVTLWQTLGDAHMRNNQLREALDCYTKAQDLL